MKSKRMAGQSSKRKKNNTLENSRVFLLFYAGYLVHPVIGYFYRNFQMFFHDSRKRIFMD